MEAAADVLRSAAASEFPGVWIPRDALPNQCRNFERRGLFRQLELDLQRYAGFGSYERSVYADFCSQVRRKACVTIRIVDSVPYVLDMYPGYQSRMKATLHGIYRALVRLGPTRDVEVVIDVTDGELQKVDLPIFVITHIESKPAGVLYPDFTFYSWPESTCPSEPSHSYSFLHHAFQRKWKLRSAPWSNRSDSVFWRGARVDDGGQRGRSVSILSSVPGANVSLMAWRSVSSFGQNDMTECVGLVDQCYNRFLTFLAGTTYSSRLKFQLLCGSTVLAARPQFIEWWSGLLQPGYHYAEVMPDWTDSPSTIAALRADPARASAIATRGQALAMSLLSPLAVDCYWWQLLSASSRVLPQPDPAVPLPPSARPLEDALLWPDDVYLSREATGPSGGRVQPVVPPLELKDPTCFGENSGGLQWDICCNTERFGPQGLVDCWSHEWTFERCCYSERVADTGAT